jgi:flavin reductase (DIM6/NTAB) family NADH-FMN oxidoreductase RutF
MDNSASTPAGKVELGAGPYLYPMPVTLVGADVSGKPTYTAVAYCGMLNSQPPVIAVSLHHSHYVNGGIREHSTFSVNMPSSDMVEATDYCGLHSGYQVDKSSLFQTFYGQLGTAPLIRECPMSLECKLVQTIEFGDDQVFIGEIVGAYSEERYMTDGLPDLGKMGLMVFSSRERNYYRVGDLLGKSFSVGKDYGRQGAPG